MESLFSLDLPFRPFGLAFSAPLATDQRIALTSFEASSCNVIKSLKISETEASNPVDLEIALPQTSILFNPTPGSNESNFVVAGDCLRVFSASDDSLELISEIAVSESNDPITCFDWVAEDETQLIVGSTDATATVVDITTGESIEKLLAHDHPINDIKYFGSTSTFVTASFDGSIRAFDLRFLMTSSIYFQAAMPLLRVSVCPPSKLACFAKGSTTATIIDLRMGTMPYGFGIRGNAQLTGVEWSHVNPDILYTSDAAGVFAESNTSTGEQRILYDIGEPIESFVISDDKVAIACSGKVEILKLPVY